jgi:hypothetical protein
MIVMRGNPFVCPECGEEWDCPIEDFVISGVIGKASEVEEPCSGCGKIFSVQCIAYDKFDVKLASR